MKTVFPMWQDINVMIFIGFGFLKVFLRTNSWTAIGFNFIVGAMACQWAILCLGFWEMILISTEFDYIRIDAKNLVEGSYGAAAAMITMNALIGKISMPQLYFLIFLEMIFYGLNRVMITGVLQAIDAGGSMTIHMFGAYFGLVCAFYFKPRRAITDTHEQGKGYYNS